MIRGTDQEIPEPITLFENHPKNVSFEFFTNFCGFSKPRQIEPILAFFNELLSTQNVNVARFARNVE